MSDSSYETSTSTMCDIKRICEECDDSWEKNKCSPSPPRRCRPQNDICFTSVVTPLSNIVPSFSGCVGSVEFCMRRKNRTVTLQWEPFNGKLTTNGISYLNVTQSICNLPPYIIDIPIYIIYKGEHRVTRIQINPQEPNIRFYLNTDGSSSNTNVGDNIDILGGAVTWIVYE